MALHHRKDGNDVTLLKRGLFLVLCPPFVKRTVRSNEESLFWRRCFGEGIGDVRAVDEKVFRGCNGIKHSSTRLIDAVSISFCEDLYFSRPCGTIADTLGLLPSIDCFNVISPNQVEDRIIRSNGDGCTKHALILVLVQLEVFGELPIVPVFLLGELATCELHYFSGVVQDVAIRHYIIGWSFPEVVRNCQKIPAFVELVVDMLGEGC